MLGQSWTLSAMIVGRGSTKSTMAKRSGLGRGGGIHRTFLQVALRDPGGVLCGGWWWWGQILKVGQSQWWWRRLKVIGGWQNPAKIDGG